MRSRETRADGLWRGRCRRVDGTVPLAAVAAKRLPGADAPVKEEEGGYFSDYLQHKVPHASNPKASVTHSNSCLLCPSGLSAFFFVFFCDEAGPWSSSFLVDFLL